MFAQLTPDLLDLRVREPRVASYSAALPAVVIDLCCCLSCSCSSCN